MTARRNTTNEGRGRFELAAGVRAPAAPPPAPTFDVVPVSALTARGQRFQCAPYHAILSAGTCADRQAARVSNHALTGSVRVRYQSCENCALGREVAARVGPAPVIVHRANAERRAGTTQPAPPYKLPAPVRTPSRIEMQRLRAGAL